VQKYPQSLYHYIDSFIDLLDSDYRILVWNALTVIANLCAVDVNKKFDVILDKYYSFLDNPFMVTVANVVGNSGKIALAKPYLIPRITNEILRVEELSTTPHLTEECKRVVAQTAIDCFNVFFNKMDAESKAKVLLFVKRQLGSSRSTLNSKAQLFLKKWVK